MFSGLLKRLFHAFLGYGMVWMIAVILFALLASGMIQFDITKTFITKDTALGGLAESLSVMIQSDMKLLNEEDANRTTDTRIIAVTTEAEDMIDYELTEELPLGIYYLYQNGQYIAYPTEGEPKKGATDNE